jgi:hypothetical protein
MKIACWLVEKYRVKEKVVAMSLQLLNFLKNLRKGGCLLKQMFKFNETGMFCKLCSIYVILPSSTFFFVTQTKKNSKAFPQHAGEGTGGRRYSSYSFTTSALDGEGEWSASLPWPHITPGEGPPLPIVQEAGWASDLV